LSLAQCLGQELGLLVIIDSDLIPDNRRVDDGDNLKFPEEPTTVHNEVEMN
jgi:hypothetical protein